MPKSVIRKIVGVIGLYLVPAVCLFGTVQGGDDVPLDVVAKLTHGPSGMGVASDDSLIVSLHQYFETRERVVRVNRDGEFEPFPNPEMGAGPEGSGGVSLDSVMGIRVSKSGIVWMLDNGRRSERTPQIVGWDYNGKKIHQYFPLGPPFTTETSFLADFVVDPSQPFIYIADPAMGADAAIMVLNQMTNLSRRVLVGHPSVQPEDIPLMVEGKKIKARRSDGSGAEPLAGVNPITIDRRGKWLYYGAMKGLTLYRISTSVLRNPDSTDEEIAAAVEVYSKKPICDSIAIDSRDNIYVGDLTKGAIQIIRPKGRVPELFAEDAQMCWPDGLTFGGDGRLYFYCSQMNRCSWFSDGKDETHAPFRVYRIKPLYQPMISNPLPDRNPLTGLRERFGLGPKLSN